jgi:DNA-directed RNA polymerase specialized sigma24 family protein
MTGMKTTFPELLASHQQRLLSYVVSLLGDADSAWDVLHGLQIVELRE